jgi:hypothetical protein
MSVQLPIQAFVTVRNSGRAHDEIYPFPPFGVPSVLDMQLALYHRVTSELCKSFMPVRGLQGNSVNCFNAEGTEEK